MGVLRLLMEPAEQPSTFGLRPKVLTSILQEAVQTDGLEMSMLMQGDGSLIALAARDGAKSRANKVAAIVSNVWASLDKVSVDQLGSLLVDNQDRRLAVQA